jgi:flagellar motor switch protein FliN/FliY
MADILSKDELDALLSQMQEPDGELAEEGVAVESDQDAVDALNVDMPERESGGLDLSPPAQPDVSTENLHMILNIPVKIQVEIGRTRLSIGEILNLCQGSVVELDHLASDMIDLTVNHRVVAHGEAVVINENFGMRVLEVESIADRIRKL